MSPGPPARAPGSGREVHAFETQPGAAADLEVDDGEADRNAEPPVEHLVQEAVARIVVVLAVAAEAELLVEIRVERGDQDGRRRAVVPLQPPGGRFAHALEALQVRRARRAPGTRRRRSPAPRGARASPGSFSARSRSSAICGQARQQRQRHGSIVARTHPRRCIDPCAGCSAARFRLPAPAAPRLPASGVPLQRGQLFTEVDGQLVQRIDDRVASASDARG